MNDKPYKDDGKTTLNLNQYREERTKKEMKTGFIDFRRRPCRTG